jgi:hypothetical protein
MAERREQEVLNHLIEACRECLDVQRAHDWPRSLRAQETLEGSKV